MIEQQKLLPDTPQEPEYRMVPLESLPGEDMLTGPAPTADLIRSIEAFGVMQPVVLVERMAVRTTPGGYDVIGGRRRIAVMRLLHAQHEGEAAARFSRIPAMVAASRDGAAALDVALNATAHKNELAYLDRLEEMWNANHSMEEIVAATGLPQQTVQRLWSIISNLHGALLAAARAGRMAFSTAEAAAKLPATGQERLCAALEESGKLTGKDVSREKEARRAHASASFDLGQLAGMPAAADVVEAKAEPAPDPQHQHVLNGYAAALRAQAELTLAQEDHRRRPKWSRNDAEAVEALLKELGL